MSFDYALKDATGFRNFFLILIIFFAVLKQSGSELCLAAYEALAHLLKTLSANFGSSDFSLLMDYYKSECPNVDGKPLLDHLVLYFLNGINELLANGLLTRSRRAVLMDWKVCIAS